MSQKAKDFNKLMEKNGSLYVKRGKTFKPTFDINEYVEKSVKWAFSQKHFHDDEGEERTPRQKKCDATQGKIGEFAVYKMLKEKGYDLKEPDWTTIRDKGESDDGDLFLGDLKIQVKTNTSKNNLFKLKREQFDSNGIYHNWGKKPPILYTYFFMCRINPGVRNAFETLSDSEFTLDNVLSLITNINFRIEVTGFININDFRKIIAEDYTIPINTKINGAFSFKKEFYYCQTGDLREIDEISKKKMIDIIILSYSANEILKKQTEDCLKSLFESEDNSEEIFNVIILESQEGISWDEYPNTKTYDPPRPYGYHKFMNFGRKIGTNPYVCLCNNDLIFEKNWASEILKTASEFPDVLSFSPICPKTQPSYGILPNSGNYFGYQIRKEISGWCIFQRREIYNQIGDLDEAFTHWFSDNDYSLTMYEKSIKHCLVSSSIVEHHDMNIGNTGPAVLSEEEMEKSTSGSYPIFKEKWKKYFS